MARDVVALDAYRESFSDAIKGVQKMLRAAHLTEFTSRTKSTASVVAKLLRQPKTRLSQVQDIRGCDTCANWRVLTFFLVCCGSFADGLINIYCAWVGRQIVMLHQFVKKTDITPPKELAVAH